VSQPGRQSDWDEEAGLAGAKDSARGSLSAEVHVSTRICKFGKTPSLQDLPVAEFPELMRNLDLTCVTLKQAVGVSLTGDALDDLDVLQRSTEEFSIQSGSSRAESIF
jgi:hypothetical protein